MKPTFLIKVFFALALLVSVNAHSQTKQNDNDTTIYTIVDEMPQFPNGGDEKMLKFLKKNIHYPDSAYNKGVQGTTYIGFIVEKDGKISHIKTLRGTNTYLDIEAMRVVRSMPAWTPGRNNGKLVRVQYALPIKFTLR